MSKELPTLSFLKNGPTPASFLFIFGLYKQTIQILQQVNVKKCNVHPVPIPHWDPNPRPLDMSRLP